jgi:hypothetical protein
MAFVQERILQREQRHSQVNWALNSFFHSNLLVLRSMRLVLLDETEFYSTHYYQQKDRDL